MYKRQTLFDGIGPLSRYWAAEYESLRTASARFADTLYRTTLDEAVLDAVAANLSILKSPTVMRQADGRFWSCLLYTSYTRTSGFPASLLNRIMEPLLIGAFQFVWPVENAV